MNAVDVSVHSGLSPPVRRYGHTAHVHTSFTCLVRFNFSCVFVCGVVRATWSDLGRRFCEHPRLKVLAVEGGINLWFRKMNGEKS